MWKIKDIHDRLIKDPKEYSGFLFLVSQRIFISTVLIYFITFLGTIGGFYTSWLSLSHMSMLAFHAYSLMIIGFVWYGFSWAEYLVYIHAPEKRWIAFFVLFLLIIVGGLWLYVHVAPVFF